MGMSDYEYRKFLSTFGFAMNEMKKWLNQSILAGGVAFPFKMDQLDTRFAFKEDRLHIFLEFEENSFLFLEEELINPNHGPGRDDFAGDAMERMRATCEEEPSRCTASG